MKMGLFRNAECRKLFIFALLDPCRFERTCPQCFGKYEDIISHVLTACVNGGDLRKYLQLSLQLYGNNRSFKYSDKTELFSLAIYGKNAFLRVVYDIIVKIGYYNA